MHISIVSNHDGNEIFKSYMAAIYEDDGDILQNIQWYPIL